MFNIVNELIGRIEETETPSLKNVVPSTSYTTKVNSLFDWKYYVNLAISIIIGIIALIIFIKFLPFFCIIYKRCSCITKCIRLLTPKRARRNRNNTRNTESLLEVTPIEMTTFASNTTNIKRPSPQTETPEPDENAGHSHSSCTYITGKGLVWEDMCPCEPK